MSTYSVPPADDKELYRNPLPPPPRDPLLRVIGRMLRKPVEVSSELAREQRGIVCLNLGLAKILLTSDADFVQYVLRDHSTNYSKEAGMWDALRLLAGNGLGLSEGPLWLRQRRMMQSMFSRQRLAELAPLMTAAITECLPEWETAAASTKPFEVTWAMERITMRVILKTICSASITDAEIAEMSRAVHYSFRHILLRMWTFFLPEWLPLPGKRAFRDALAKVDRIVFGVIGQRRPRPDAADDLLSLLFAARDENGQGMTDRQLRDEVVTFYVAGFETTAAALGFTLYLLCKHPQEQEKVRAELARVLGGRTPGHADLGELPYTRMVIQEAMRLYPPAWFIPRKALADDQFGGYHIPKGSIIVLHFHAVHHNPKQWPDPEAFKPERFASDAAPGNRRGAYLPFGVGAHQCIGMHFAMMEAQLAVAMLLQRFRFRLAPGHEVEIDRSVALRSKTGVPLCVERIGEGVGQTPT
jgi:cytochrome P450